MCFKKINLISSVVAMLVFCAGIIAAYTAFTTQPQPIGSQKEAGSRVAVLISQFHARGEFVTGHEGLACTDCHQASAGSIRQQLQAIAKNSLFDAGYAVDFGFRKVSSQDCLACHNRDNDRHPIHRFNEPRFIEVVKDLPANQCLGCHSEHNGRTVKLDQIGFCKACHSDLEIKNDPIDISHSHLVKSEEWGSCLGCHDFHGNHRHKAPKLYQQVKSISEIEDYFAGGISPYGLDKKHVGMRE